MCACMCICVIEQENSQIRELQQENKELKQSLEDHQSALELIMSKYREQVGKLVKANHLERSIVQMSSDDSKVCMCLFICLYVCLYRSLSGW